MKNFFNHPVTRSALVAAVTICVLLVADTALAQVGGLDSAAAKLDAFRSGLKKIAVALLGLAGLLASAYIGFGRQDGKQRVGAVMQGAIVASVVGSVVTWLAS